MMYPCAYSRDEHAIQEEIQTCKARKRDSENKSRKKDRVLSDA